jgi:hypothetical protein
MKNMFLKKITMRTYGFYVTCLLLLISVDAAAQDGNAGINEANTKVRGYFSAGTNLMCYRGTNRRCKSISEMECRRP